MYREARMDWRRRLCLVAPGAGLDRAEAHFLMLVRGLGSSSSCWEERLDLYACLLQAREELTQRDDLKLTRDYAIVKANDDGLRILLILLLLCAFEARELDGGGGGGELHVDLCVTLEEVYAAAVKCLRVRARELRGFALRALYVHLLDPVAEYRFEGVGDAVQMGDRTTRGDIVVHLKIGDHPTHRMDTVVSKYDLHATIPVPFLDYLYGASYILKHLDASSIAVDYAAQSGKRVVLIPEKGLIDPETRRRAPLYVFFEVALPVLRREVLDAPVNRMLLRRIFAASPGAT